MDMEESPDNLDDGIALHFAIPLANPTMCRGLYEASRDGDIVRLIELRESSPDPNLFMLGFNPNGNTCLRIAVMLGHADFAMAAWGTAPLLFSSLNIDRETPLIAALMAANKSLASDMTQAASLLMINLVGGVSVNEMLLMTDRREENVLHHALRNGFEGLALRFLELEPALSEQVNKTNESPMHMASRRGYLPVVTRLLEIEQSADTGPSGDSALHAAVTAGNMVIVNALLAGRAGLTRITNDYRDTPLGTSIEMNNKAMVIRLLEQDPDLAYFKNQNNGLTPFANAASRGFLHIAEEIFRLCPDSVYSPDIMGWNPLHQAIDSDRSEFIDYILRTPQLHRLINQASNTGNLPLHIAVDQCKPQAIRSLLSHRSQDYTALNTNNVNAVDFISHKGDLFKTLKWNEAFTLVSKVIPSGLVNRAADNVQRMAAKQAEERITSLTQAYVSNTTIVAALLATITFAAAFTLPGGYSSDPSNSGLPIFARKASFQAFLISDIIAMCSSLAVTFLCVLATWEDLDFLLNYRAATRVLMWCAYASTCVAFATGLFTVLAPTKFWIGVFTLVLCSLLPFLSKLMSDWPIYKLHYRVGRLFRGDLIARI